MSRGKGTLSARNDQLKRSVEATECLAKQARKDGVPHEDAMWLVKKLKRCLSRNAKGLESALRLKPRGRPAGSYDPKNLELVEKALHLKKQGMKLEDIAQKLFGHRLDPPSVQYIQILISRFMPLIKKRERKRIVDELRRRGLARAQTPPRLSPKRGELQLEAMWVDPRWRPTPRYLRSFAAGASRATKRRNPE